MDKVAKNLTRVVSSNSRGLTIETAHLAKITDGASTCILGDTSVLVTAVSNSANQTHQDMSFLPLTVNYKQKMAAIGRIPMTHMRREIGLTESEILIGRMIDRSIRPMFPKGYCNDTQIICNLLAVDGQNDPDVLAINGASASLSVSDIPWNGPIGAVRVGLLGERMIANPLRKEQENCRLNLVVAANKLGNLIMMDGSSQEPVLLPDISKVIKYAIKECKHIIDSITKLQKAVGKSKRSVDLQHIPSAEQQHFVFNFLETKLRNILLNHSLDKLSRDDAFRTLQEELTQQASKELPDIHKTTIAEAFKEATKIIYREILQSNKIRCDGRGIDEIRPITCQVDLYKPLHGSALFTRGQTQVLCSTTFDSPDSAFRADPITSIISGVKEKNFMLHYEFPPYATKDIGRVGAMPDRREIGHGALAEKALRPLIPDHTEMTTRLMCEVLESNGSSSMASVCAGSMSLMDAGVALREHVAGVAMGLFSHEQETKQKKMPNEPEYTVLTDILGLEDYIGDMDFKIAGTKRAITALQLDVKPTSGVSQKIILDALTRAHWARGEIIKKMEDAIKVPSKKKDNHPVIKTICVPQHKVASLVGFGGSNLKRLMAKTGVRLSGYGDQNSGNELHTSENQDNFIMFAPNKEAMEEAEALIKNLLEQRKEPELEFNGIYTATIQEVRPNGVMVTLYPNMAPSLLPLSQLDVRTVAHPSALNLEAGQQILVKYFGRDPASGHMRLSRKSLMMSGTSRMHRPIE